MNKILLTLLISATLLTMSCAEKQEDLGENPYPDGVYPFEVTNLSHERLSVYSYKVSWTAPNDKYFSKVDIEFYVTYGDINKTKKKAYPNEMAYDVKLTKNSITLIPPESWATASTDYDFYIKCVDKFGNVSEGVKYVLPWVFIYE